MNFPFWIFPIVVVAIAIAMIVGRSGSWKDKPAEDREKSVTLLLIGFVVLSVVVAGFFMLYGLAR